MNCQSKFTGVFTLKTQEEASQLANAVQRLVEKSVSVFQLIESGGGGELKGYMDTILLVAPSFVDLTHDQAERERALAVISALSRAEANLSQYFTPIPRFNVDEATREAVSRNMGVFLEKLADLCDMMEENQLTRGVLIVQQALKFMEMLSAERPASQIFIPKLNNASAAFTAVDRLLDNRISVADEGEVKVKLQKMRDEEKAQSNELVFAARALHQEPKNEGLILKYKDVMTRQVDTLSRLEAMLQSEVRIKTSSSFSHQKVSAALDALGDAVQCHDRNLATENARNIVKEIEQAGSAELRAKTKEVVQATIEALGDGGKQAELDKAMAELRELAQAVGEAEGVPEGTMRQNQQLRQQLMQASKDISHNVEDIFAPRSERFAHLV